ncbi:MAG: hypothetical protein ACYDD6_02400 [Acidimicrobiales bacterium]
MIVSKERTSTSQAQVERQLTWLQQQLAWEAVLTRLRQAAGVLPPEQLPTPETVAA